MANPRTTHGEENPGGRAPYLKMRKRLKELAMREYPGRKLAWQGGILYFVGKKQKQATRVPGVQEVPKPGRPALSFKAADGPVIFKKPRRFRRSKGKA